MRRVKQFPDWISELFPEDSDDNVVKLTKTVTFQVTDACNLKCTYCYQINKGVRVMPFGVAKTFIDKLLRDDPSIANYISSETSPAIVLEFIGGEPFLEVELIDQIVTYFRSEAIKLRHPWAHKFCISICSNGVLYTDPKVQHFLQKYHDVLSFSVTVDGTKELHDKCRVFPDGSPSYDLAHHAARDWMNRGYYMGSKITVSPQNVYYVADCLLQMIKDGYTEINCNTVYEQGWELKHATEIYKQFKKFTDVAVDIPNIETYAISYLTETTGRPEPTDYNSNWCGGTGSMLGIDPDGYIYPCIRYMESSLGTDQKPLRIGDVWNGIAQCPEYCDTVECLKCITRRSQSTDECFYCVIAEQCSWCSAHNYQCTGTPNKRVTYSCDMHKARSLANVYFHNTLVSKHRISEVVNLWVPEKWAVPIIGEEEYKNLVELTRSVGGFVNDKNITQVVTDKVCSTAQDCEEVIKCSKCM